MKKIIKVLGLLAVFVLAMFLNTNAIDNSKTESFSLADAISLNSANAECPWYMPAYFCDDDPSSYGEVEVPYTKTCRVLVTTYHDGVPLPNFTTVERELNGNDCEDAQSMGPLDCEPYSPC